MIAVGSRCAVHVEQAAADTCARCGNFVCNACYELEDGHAYCRPCLDKVGTRGQQSSRATTALVLSLLSLLIYCFPLAIPGVIIGHMELTAIRNGEAPMSGRNIALGAVVVGWIVIALSVIGVGFVVLTAAVIS